MEKEESLGMLFKSLIKLSLERYIDNSHNSRYFFEKFYDAYGLSLAILKKEYGFEIDENHLKEMQSLWFNYNNIKSILNKHNPNDKKYFNLVRNEFINNRTLFLLKIQSEINKDQEIINLTMDKMKNVIIEEFDVMKNFYVRGMVGISSSEWWR